MHLRRGGRHKNHVRPSNFTLSILVKLLGRSRRLNQAFTTVEETCKRFDLQANIHVRGESVIARAVTF